MIPPFRAIPPSYGQLSADPEASHVVIIRDDPATVARLATTMSMATREIGGGVQVAGSRKELEVLGRSLASEAHPAASLLQRYLEPEGAWKLRTQALALDRPVVMGIVNLTEDSFSGDGVGGDVSGALARADALRDAGATIIDVGAETARADRPVMDEGAESAVVGACVAALAREEHVVSIDTYKRAVAESALSGGAEIVNDISGLTQGTGAAEAAAAAGAGYVLNYSYSVPKRRPDQPPVYGDVMTETLAWMYERVAQLREVGLDDSQITIDPGIAFGKSHDEDIQVLRRIGELRSLGLPVLLAHSRKNFLGSVNGTPPEERDLETHVVTTLAYAQGIRLFRVHDAAGAARAARMAAAIVDTEPGTFAPDATSWPWRAGASAAHMAGANADKAAPPGQRW